MARRRHRLNINAPELVRIIGFLILVEAMFMSVPLLYSLITGGDEASVFAISIAANVAVGLAIVLTVKPRVREMGDILIVRNAAVYTVRYSPQCGRGFL